MERRVALGDTASVDEIEAEILSLSPEAHGRLKRSAQRFVATLGRYKHQRSWRDLLQEAMKSTIG